MMRPTLYSLVALFAGTAAAGVEDSVLRITASKKAVDPSAPWQFEEVEQQSHLGVVLPGNRILTSAYAVADAAFVEAQRFGSSKKIELKVTFADYEVNLALLEAIDLPALQSMTPLVLGDDLELNAKPDIYKARDANQLSRLAGSLQEVGIFTAVTSAYSVASYLLKVQQTGLGWSEPVLDGGKLVAIATGQDNNYVYATPASVIRHFLEDDLGPGYRGFPAIGVSLAPLVAPEMRRMLKAEGTDDGVRVAEIAKGGSFSKILEKDDVILAVAGVRISELGFYAHPKWGKMHMKHLLNQRYGGDALKLKVLRQGKQLELDGKLERFDSNRGRVVIHRYGEPMPHLIFGGLVFQELNRPYLKQWGREWEDLAPLDLLYSHFYESDPTDIAAERIIFVTRVLSDDFNRGYSEINRQIVESVNGIKMTSMASLHEALKKPVMHEGKRYAQITLVRDGGEVILAYDGLLEAHARIAKTYEVSSPASFFTP